jgi:hypothetical protein
MSAIPPHRLTAVRHRIANKKKKKNQKNQKSNVYQPWHTFSTETVLTSRVYATGTMMSADNLTNLPRVETVDYVPETMCSALYVLKVDRIQGAVKIGWTRNINNRMWHSTYDAFAAEHKSYSFAILFRFHDCCVAGRAAEADEQPCVAGRAAEADEQPCVAGRAAEADEQPCVAGRAAEADEHQFIADRLEAECLRRVHDRRDPALGTEWFCISPEEAADLLRSVCDTELAVLPPDVRPRTTEMTHFRTRPQSAMLARMAHARQRWFAASCFQHWKQAAEADAEEEEEETEEEGAATETAVRPTPDGRPGQRQALNAMLAHYETATTGHIEQACGAGKALLSVFFADALLGLGQLQASGCGAPPTVLWGVPSLRLLGQMLKEARRVFPGVPCAFVGSGGDVPPDALRLRTPSDVAQYVTAAPGDARSSSLRVLVTTYQSARIVSEAAKHAACEAEFLRFALKVGDECHHLVDPSGGREWAVDAEAKEAREASAGFGHFLQIPCERSLFMTATTVTATTVAAHDPDPQDRRRRRDLREGERPATMDHPLFGELIEGARRSVRWAIENGLITDYRMVVLRHTYAEVDALRNSLPAPPPSWASRVPRRGRRTTLLMAAAQTVAALTDYDGLSHVLFFTGTTNEADVAVEMLRVCAEYFGVNDHVFIRAVHTRACHGLGETMAEARAAPMAIVPCCGMLREGVDEPRLNGVVAATPMHAHIATVQALTRANRKDDERQPNKIAHILLPTPDGDGEDGQYGDDEDAAAAWDSMRDVLHSMRRYDDAACSRVVVSNGRLGAAGRPTKRAPAAVSADKDDSDDECYDALGRFKLRVYDSLQVRAGTSASKQRTLRRFCQQVTEASQLHGMTVHGRADFKRLQQRAPSLVDEPPGGNATGTAYAEFGWQLVCTAARAYYADADACREAVVAVAAEVGAGSGSGSEEEDAEYMLDVQMALWHQADPRIPPNLRCFYPKAPVSMFCAI